VTNTDSTAQCVRCTLQKSIDEVPSCVADNVVMVDWPPQIQSYTSASSCLGGKVYISTQEMRILGDTLGALFFILIWPKITHAAKGRLKFLNRQPKVKKEITELREL